MKAMSQGEHKGDKEKPKETVDKAEPVTVKYLVRSLQALQSENEFLRMQLKKFKSVPSGRVGVPFIAFGALALVGSIITSSTVLAFIGLGLTFWGALFLFVRPVKFVKETLLDSTAISSYTTIDRIIEDLGYKGKALYIPPFPKDVYLPDYLKGLKEMVVLISAEETTTLPSIEEMAKKQFILENPKGICITPPGYGVLDMLEKELRKDFTKITLEALQETLPSAIVANLELAREVEIRLENNLIHVRISGSVYKELYSLEHRLKSIHILGCPLASAVACALAKASGKAVTITRDVVSPDLDTIELWYQILGA
ncbi:MAG: hypothetical protein QW146_08705 [Candidatus Bathyarchaeia archaeon]